MWDEFNKHFKDPNRDHGGQVNHHDFLDASIINKEPGMSSRRSFFARMGGHNVGASADHQQFFTHTKVDLGYDRLI
jgi:hypothetical protein